MRRKFISALLAALVASAALMPAALAAERYDVLQPGDKDGSVLAVQEKLIEEGYLPKSANSGYFGVKTESAVKSYQADAGLAKDGKVGPATMAKLMGKSFDAVSYSGDLQKDSFREGDEDIRVGDIQRRLMELSYIELEEVTAYYGSTTATGIRLFQRANKLTQDGICGPETLKKLFSSNCKAYTIYPGDRGNDVTRLQKRLAELKYFTGEVTDFYGDITRAAVVAFQKKNGLTADGVAGRRTLEALYSSKAKAKTSETAAKTEKTSSSGGSESSGSGSGVIADAIKLAKSKLGCRYVWSTEGPNTFDCSGLVYYLLKNAGVKVSRLNAAGFSQNTAWEKVSSIKDLQKGDLVFFRSSSSSRVCHAGFYIGDGQFIHAASAKQGVITSSITSGYYNKYFVVGRRPSYS